MQSVRSVRGAGLAALRGLSLVVVALVVLAVAVAVAVAVVALPAPVFADTATPPPTSQDSSNLLLAIVALGALSAVVVLTRPRRGKQ